MGLESRYWDLFVYIYWYMKSRYTKSVRIYSFVKIYAYIKVNQTYIQAIYKVRVIIRKFAQGYLKFSSIRRPSIHGGLRRCHQSD